MRCSAALVRRALLIGVSGGGINVALAERRLRPALERLGFDEISVCSDGQATRAGMLAAIDRLLDVAEPGDAVFMHYFGHGGRVRFVDLEHEQVFGYLTCTRQTREFEVVLDIELSRRLTRLDARCGNVTVMLDCCHSGEIVRERQAAAAPGAARELPAPAWARAALQAEPELELAIDSHPGIVRLCGASPKREAFAATRGGRHIGRMTEAFLAALDEAGDDWPQLSWQTFGHRVREHVIGALDMEGQWVALAGPRARRLFSRECVRLPGSVSFIPADEPGRGYLRVGWQQGIEVGDRFALIDPRVGAEGPRTVGVAEVLAVQRNRADVDCGEVELRAGTPAVLLRAAAPLRVAADDAELGDALATSPWLARADAGADAQLRRDGDRLVVSVADRCPARVPADQLAAAVITLEHHARVRALLRNLAAQQPHDSPLSWRVQILGDPPSTLTDGATLDAGTRIAIELRLATGDVFHWFVHVLLIDPVGRLSMLNPRMPEGIELAPGDVEQLGVRFGRRGSQGITLRWPASADASIGPVSLLMLASRRPIELGHLVDADALDDDLTLDLRELSADPKRDRKPEHTRACTWARLDFLLRQEPSS